VYERRDYYEPEISRSKYLLSRAYLGLSKPELASAYFTEAVRIYRHLRPEDKRGDDELSELDFDNIIAPRDR
jgi:hypothetical protein